MLRGRWCHVIVLNDHASTEDETDDVKDSFYKELECVFDKFRKYHMRYWQFCYVNGESWLTP
jgi:hypothetical protein